MKEKESHHECIAAIARNYQDQKQEEHSNNQSVQIEIPPKQIEIQKWAFHPLQKQQLEALSNKEYDNSLPYY
jgi:hypothetical protein